MAKRASGPMSECHRAGILVTTVLHTVLVVSMLFWTAGTARSSGPIIDTSKMQVIEAELAFKSERRSRQPQKRRQRHQSSPLPDLSREATPEAAEELDWRRFRRSDESDVAQEEGIERPEVGAFDGSKTGFAEVNKGHPYLRELTAAVPFEVPKLETGAGVAEICVRLAKAGAIVDKKVNKYSGNTNLDRAAEEALRRLVKVRNEHPIPVPPELYAWLTHWTCFRLGL